MAVSSRNQSGNVAAGDWRPIRSADRPKRRLVEVQVDFVDFQNGEGANLWSRSRSPRFNARIRPGHRSYVRRRRSSRWRLEKAIFNDEDTLLALFERSPPSSGVGTRDQVSGCRSSAFKRRQIPGRGRYGFSRASQVCGRHPRIEGMTRDIPSRTSRAGAFGGKAVRLTVIVGSGSGGQPLLGSRECVGSPDSGDVMPKSRCRSNHE